MIIGAHCFTESPRPSHVPILLVQQGATTPDQQIGPTSSRNNWLVSQPQLISPAALTSKHTALLLLLDMNTRTDKMGSVRVF